MQASAQLKAAEAAAPDSSERATLIAGALGVLRRVPLASNLEYLTSQLAYLKAYKVCVCGRGGAVVMVRLCTLL